MATALATAGIVGALASPAAASTRLEAENSSYGGLCGDSQSQYSYTLATGETVLFNGGDNCTMTFTAATTTSVERIRWFGGGAAASICGVFIVKQGGVEKARTASTCSVGGASPTDWQTPTFPAHTLTAGTFQVVWDANTSWQDAHVDWIEIASAVVNQPPTAVQVAPANNAVLPYNGQHTFSVNATDPEGSYWSAGVQIYYASGALRASLGTSYVASGATATTAPVTLAPGNYYWTAYATDDQGASGATVGPSYFSVASLAFKDGWYVGLGDSYSSGEGAPVETLSNLWLDTFWPGTDTDNVNLCHRSDNAWPVLVSHSAELPTRFRFAACSGAETRNINNVPMWNEQLQLDQIPADTTLITMSMGGNDAEFADILKACEISALQLKDCNRDQDKVFTRRLNRLNAEIGSVPSQQDVKADPDIVNVRPLAEVYQLIRTKAPDARVVIVGYPQLFTPTNYTCSGIRPADQTWMNGAATRLNDVIEGRALQRGFEFADVENVMDGHRLCSLRYDYLNGLDTTRPSLSGPPFIDSHYDFHPDAAGHNALSTRVLNQILTPRQPAPCTPNTPMSTSVDNPATTTLDVHWQTSMNCGLQYYRVFRNGVEVPSTSGCYRPLGAACTDTGLVAGTTYTYTARAVSLGIQGGLESGSSPSVTGRTTTAATTNPGMPAAPTGPASISTATNASYSATATDPDGNNVRYVFDWSDGTPYCTTGYVASGASASCTHRWSTVTTTCVRAYTEDSYGARSAWGPCKVVDVANGYPNTPSTPSGPTAATAGAAPVSYSTSATDVDNDNLRYVFDWGDQTTATTGYFASGATASASHTWTTPGSYCVRAYAEQSVGGTSPWSGCLTVTVSAGNLPPSTPAAPSGPASISTATTATFTAVATDPESNTVRYVFDWSDGTPTCTTGYVSSGTAASCTHRFTTVGTYCVKAYAQDSVGATSAFGACLVVNVSNAYPNTPSTPSGSTAVTGGSSYSYSTSATDVDNDNLRYVFDWGDGSATTATGYVASGATASASHTWNASGSYCVKAYAEQSVGGTSLWSGCLTVTVNLPPGPPAAPSGPAGISTATTATFTASATDPESSTVRYVFDWSDGTATCTTGYVASGTAASCTHRFATVGTYCVKAYAQDSVGAIGAWSGCKVVDVSNAYPNTPATPSGSTAVTAGSSYSYSTSATDVDNDNLRYVFDWGDGTATTATGYVASGATANASHTWAASGSYCVKAYAEQSVGGTSLWSGCLTVSVNTAPATPAAPSGPAGISTATTATFTASATDPDGNNVRYVFDWSDNTAQCTTGYVASGTAASCTHRFATPGTYCVRAYAQDSVGAMGAFSACKVVDVSNAYPNTPSTPSGTTSTSTGVSNTYSTAATDTDNDNLRYVFDWGDLTTTTTGYFAAGATVTASHTWGSPGTYCVRAYAEQSVGGTSLWSGCLTVTVAQGNRAPSTPAAPTGPANVSTATNATYSASASDPDGNTVRYVFDWSDSTAQCTTGYVTSGTSASCTHRFATPGTYCVKAYAQDSNGATSAFGACLVVNVSNAYPNTPSTPSGPAATYKGETNTYSAAATDTDNDSLRYVFDWGDGSTTTTGYFASGATATASHAWAGTGSFCVKVYAEQSVGGTSLYSSCLTVTVTGPANDDFASATVTSGTTQDTRGATVQAGEPLCPNMTKTVWFRFTPSTTGTYRISTAGSSYDTVLAVYTGSTLATLGSQQCNDDANSTVQSQVDTPLAAGTAYYVQVGGFTNAYGTLSVSMTKIGGL